MPTAPSAFNTRRAGLNFARRLYLPRIVGLAIGFWCVLTALYPGHQPVGVWILLAVNGFIWPHIAYQWSIRSEAPYATEIRNLLIDALLGGMWVAIMGFNALPAVVILSMMGMNNIASGGPSLYFKGLMAQIIGALVTCAILGFPLYTTIHSAAGLSVPADDLHLPSLPGLCDLPNRQAAGRKATGAIAHQHA